ncbi:MAG TPA: hypothetical protein VGM90_07280 [Kofleriaceae bacterium]|jgi:hypothetical protein
MVRAGSTIGLALVAACGSSAPRTQAAQPLPPDKGVDDGTLTKLANSECIPAGRYRVQWDFMSGKVGRPGKTNDEECRQKVIAYATEGLGELTIQHDASLVILWPSEQRAVEKGPCGFEITSHSPMVAEILFSGGTGNGNASWSIDMSGEACTATKVGFQLVKNEHQ